MISVTGENLKGSKVKLCAKFDFIMQTDAQSKATLHSGRRLVM